LREDLQNTYAHSCPDYYPEDSQDIEIESFIYNLTYLSKVNNLKENEKIPNLERISGENQDEGLVRILE